jgi:hypothetical protein
VHIRGFYPPAACAEVAKVLQRDPSRLRNWKVASPGRGLESSDVATVGLEPYNMVASRKDPEAERAYFDGALACMREMRGHEPLPVLSPLDKLRLELDELWPRGATVTKNRQGRPFVAGLARVMVREGRGGGG